MERLTLNHLGKKSLYYEHIHRYKLASKLTYGYVVDAACGIGYGSTILNNDAMQRYEGYDIDHSTLSIAKSNFSKENINFNFGTILDLPVENEKVDCFISFETFEHLERPDLAVKEIYRVLKQKGLLIGSVPIDIYEEKCAQVYGPNPYHIQKISYNQLKDLLKLKFHYIKILSATFVLGTLLCKTENVETEINGKLIVNDNEGRSLGSYIFIASNDENTFINACNKLIPQFEFGLAKVDLDFEEILPNILAVQKMETMISSRDKAICSMEAMISSRDEALCSMEAMISSRDKAICSMEAMISSRDKAICSMEAMISSRDEAICSMEKMIKERDELILMYEKQMSEINK